MSTRVGRRIVYFIGGYDPRGGRHYHSMFKRESAKMAPVMGAKIEVSKRRSVGRHTTAWDVSYQEGEDRVHTDYRVYNFDDIIRKYWIKSKFSMYAELVRSLLFLYKGGAFFHRWRVRKPAMMICGYWLMWFTILLVFAIGLSVLAVSLLNFAVWVKLLVVVGIVLSIGFLGSFLEKKSELDWFFRSLIFFAGQKNYNDAEYEQRRIDLSREIIEADKTGDYDEVLIVGYSAGSLIATESLARAMQEDPELGKRSAQLNLLTIAGCIGCVAGNSLDKGYHPYLRHLASRENIDWLDISEKYDVSAEYYVNPFELFTEFKGANEDSIPSPRLERSRFFELYSEDKFNRIKKNARIIHNQFISASDKDGKYNYFRMTCGSSSLRQQY